MHSDLALATSNDRAKRLYNELDGLAMQIWRRAHADNIHLGYWEDTTDTHRDSAINLNRQLAHRLRDLRPGSGVLDAGCGYGGAAAWLATTYGVRVLGISISEKQVAAARRSAVARGLQSQLRFEERSYFDTRLEGASFDAVWAIESLCYAEDKRPAFAELARVLKPGGQIVIAEGTRREGAMDDQQAQLLTEMERRYYFGKTPTRAEYTDMLNDAGFDEVSIVDITPQVYPSVRYLDRMARWTPVPSWVLDRFDLPSLSSSVANRLLLKAVDQELWRYNLICATKTRP